MSDPTTKTVMVDGLPVVTTEAGEAAIIKLTRAADAAGKALTDANTAHTLALAAKDADLAKKDAEIATLKGQVLDAAAIDARVQARADLIASAKLVQDGDYTGKTDAEIIRAAVVGKFGDAVLKDSAGKTQDDTYLRARFDIALGDAKQPDPVRDAMSHIPAIPTVDKAVVDARAKMLADMQSGHRPTTTN